jgi:hypothetical protein
MKQQSYADKINHKEQANQNNQSYSPIDLTKLPGHVVLSSLKTHIKSERKSTHLILWHIVEVERRKLYLQAGHTSIYQHLLKEHGYSETAAYDRVKAARILALHPEISKHLEEGSIDLTKLVMLSTCLNKAKKSGEEVSVNKVKEILNQLPNKNKFETKKILAVELNQTPNKTERVTPQKDGTIWVEIGFKEAQYHIMMEALDVLSHVIPDKDKAEAITHAFRAIIKKAKGPEAKKDRKSDPKNAPNKKQKSDSADIENKSTDIINASETKEQNSETKKEPTITQSFAVAGKKRKYISVKITRKVKQDACYCCSLVDPKTGIRCNSTYQIQTDHIIPLALGGTNDLDNLRVLCGVHNRSEAVRRGLKMPAK